MSTTTTRETDPNPIYTALIEEQGVTPVPDDDQPE
ncbi:hypothetical protein CLV40_10165 [Actinokineospora auranticolor]|uniref:Uncharacterized protein n=1 Tax=Actinokineospora auranticolor TaxID=155976 RepID=A0A2S6H073_9PSEU|nr:hypothetical protein CLV40_10165 [Actinokineospora auranticolor]